MPLRDTPDGIVLRVRVTPRSARDAVDGIEPTAEGDAVKVRVRALPADGAANEAIERVIAQWLGVAKRDVSLRSGARSPIPEYSPSVFSRITIRSTSEE